MGCLTGLGITTSSTLVLSSGQKRKQDKGTSPKTSRMKRSKSDNSQMVTANLEPDVKEHKQDIPTIQSIEEPEANSLASREIKTYSNRIHTCLITSLARRLLHLYKSVKELLEAFHDAIAGYRSLLDNRKMLYQDIFENNIIITTPAAEGDPKGRLIDMDLGKELNSVPSGASHRTGTMQFIAIEVLQGKGHTYRHNLELFFYVFI